MRVVLEVNTGKLLQKLAKNPDDRFNTILTQAEKQAQTSDQSVVDIVTQKLENENIRLSRYFGNIRQSDNEIVSELKKDADDAVSRAQEIIRNRVDQYGVSEPSIQRQGSRRIIVELPGVTREEEAKQLLQGTALLEFKILKDPQVAISIMKKIDDVLAGKGVADTSAVAKTETKNKKAIKTKNDTSLASNDTAASDTSKQLTKEEFAKEHPFFSVAIINPQSNDADAYVSEDNKQKVEIWLNRPDVKKVIPDNTEFDFSAKPVGYQNGKGIYKLYCVNKQAELTGGVITDAEANIDPSTSSPIVTMQMNADGASEWSRITGANIGKRIAIVLDGAVYSAPVVQGKIPGGNSQITGMANMDEAKILSIVLKAGALPAPVEIIEQRTVGPSLGEDSVNSGLTSSIIGYLVIGIFMIIYYQKSGVIAAISLSFTILLILGVLAGFNATLTLPGIAGIILTMGMAVDANVLIYERIREELETGKTIKACIDSGFSKAYPAIIDSNITTFLTGIILYQFGTGPVQGFALTLMIGLVASLFGALYVGKVCFDYLLIKDAKVSVG
jgi:SecD/SecF fusion protein